VGFARRVIYPVRVTDELRRVRVRRIGAPGVLVLREMSGQSYLRGWHVRQHGRAAGLQPDAGL
jgi:hypothetical protein